MSKIDLTQIIKGTKQPSFDDEMIQTLINGLNSGSVDYYHFIIEPNAIERQNSGEINGEEEQNFLNGKISAEIDRFRHIFSTEPIGYCFSRLYINCCKKDIISLANFITEKCQGKGIPYYFKYSLTDRKRADQIVMYSNLDNLGDYIQVLQEIAQEHPEIIDKCGKPPLLTGTIDEWIGIGDEPTQEKSYNEIRAETIKSVLERLCMQIDDDGFVKYISEGLDFDSIRGALREKFKAVGIDLDRLAFNDENYELYMKDEQTRKEYDSKRKQATTKEGALLEMIPIQELMILKQIGGMPKEFNKILEASLNRYSYLLDVAGEKNDMSSVIQKKFGLSPDIIVTNKSELKSSTIGGKIDITDKRKEKIIFKLVEDIIKHFKDFFKQEKANIKNTIEKYKDLCSSILEDEQIKIEKTDLESKLRLLAYGEEFFKGIGISPEDIEQVCRTAQETLKEIEEKRAEKVKPKLIEPSQIKSATSKARIGAEDIHQAAQGIKVTINPHKKTITMYDDE